jgi:hypothetical protein
MSDELRLPELDFDALPDILRPDQRICPTLLELDSYLLHKQLGKPGRIELDDADRQKIERHLQTNCPNCSALVELFRRYDDAAARAIDSAVGNPELPRGNALI